MTRNAITLRTIRVEDVRSGDIIQLLGRHWVLTENYTSARWAHDHAGVDSHDFRYVYEVGNPHYFETLEEEQASLQSKLRGVDLGLAVVFRLSLAREPDGDIEWVYVAVPREALVKLQVAVAPDSPRTSKEG